MKMLLDLCIFAFYCIFSIRPCRHVFDFITKIKRTKRAVHLEKQMGIIELNHEAFLRQVQSNESFL